MKKLHAEYQFQTDILYQESANFFFYKGSGSKLV